MQHILWWVNDRFPNLLHIVYTTLSIALLSAIYGTISERQIVRIILRHICRRHRNILRVTYRIIRIGVIALAVPFTGIDELQRIRRNGELDLVVLVPVLPQGSRQRSLNEYQPSFGKIFWQSDMVLFFASYPYPCSDVIPVWIIINGNIKSDERAVCSSDNLAIFADATDSMNV